MAERLFDWAPRFDERSLDYPALTASKYRTQIWPCLMRLNQGNEGACVGFGWTHTIDASPRPRVLGNYAARSLYKLAQTLDEWPGENYEGTSVLAGAKAAKQKGWISRYEWCTSIDQVASTVSWQGPVVIGVAWHEGMRNTDAAGFIHPDGNVVGGHCVSVRGLVVSDNPYFVIRNSWGMRWGKMGDCYIKWSDLAGLLADNAEACVPIE